MRSSSRGRYLVPEPCRHHQRAIHEAEGAVEPVPSSPAQRGSYRFRLVPGDSLLAQRNVGEVHRPGTNQRRWAPMSTGIKIAHAGEVVWHWPLLVSGCLPVKIRLQSEGDRCSPLQTRSQHDLEASVSRFAFGISRRSREHCPVHFAISCVC